jgi:hypothetical protein
MGTDIMPIANHSISFKNKNSLELANEIGQILNKEKLQIDNLYNNSIGRSQDVSNQLEWICYKQDESDPDCKVFEFCWNSEEHFDIDEHKITFFSLTYRYWEWFETLEKIQIEKVKAYMFFVVKLLGGDRLLYLADNSHPLEKYLDFEGTFEQIEQELFKKYGPPKNSYKEVVANFRSSYFIDRIS